MSKQTHSRMCVLRNAVLALLFVMAVGVAWFLLRLDREGAVPTDFEDRILRGTTWRLPDRDTIEGVVLDPQDRPVPGATVLLEKPVEWTDYPNIPESVVRKTETDDSGHYRATGLPPGRYDTVVYTDVLCGYSLAHASHEPQVGRPGGNVYMRPSGTVKGIVRTAGGEPLVGARVGIQSRYSVSLRQYDYPAFAAPLWTMTDDEGRFALDHVTQPKVCLFAEAEGYCRNLSKWIGVPTDDAEIVMAERGNVSGRLLHAETGEPVADQWTVLAMERPTGGYNVTQTDREGHFCFPHCPAGSYKVILRSKDYVIGGRDPIGVMVREGEDVADLDVPVVEAGRVAGCVYDADSGKGIEGARVRASCRSVSTEWHHPEVATNADGTYLIEGLTPGTCEVTYESPAGYPERSAGPKTELRCSVKSGEAVTGVDFALRSGSRIRGRFVDPDGRGIPCVSFSANGTVSSGHGMTDNEGWFSVAGLSPDDDVTFTAYMFGNVGGDYQDCSVNGGLTKVGVPPEGDLDGVEVTARPPTWVSGVVLNAAGQPVEGATVVAKDFEGRTAGTSKKTDEKGRFHISKPDCQRFFLQAKRFFKTTPVDIAPVVELDWGERCEDVAVYLEPPPATPPKPRAYPKPVALPASKKDGLTISGRVTDENGKPLFEAHVSARYVKDRTVVESGFGETDADGQYVIEGLPDYPYEVTAQASGYRGYERVTKNDVPAGSKDVGFQLKRKQ